MTARPAGSDETGTESWQRTEAPRVARRPESVRHAAAASGATTTTSETPEPARRATSRQTSSGSAAGPAGSSTPKAPVGATWRPWSGQKSWPRRSFSSGDRGTGVAAGTSRVATSSRPRESSPARARAGAAAGPASAGRTRQTSPARASDRTRSRWARASDEKPTRARGATETPDLAKMPASRAVASHSSTMPSSERRLT